MKVGGGRRLAAELALVLVPGAFAAFLASGLPFGADQGMYAAVADGIRAGLQPYRDVFDIKPPGVYYAYALAFTAFGRSAAAVRWLDVIAAVVTALAVWRINRKWGTGYWGALAAGLAGFALLAAFDFWNLGQSDNYAAVFVAVALAVVLTGDGGSWRRAAAAGALLGIAFWFKYTAMTAMAAVWFAGGFNSKRFLSDLFKRFLVSAAGAFGIIVLGIGYLAVVGAAPAFTNLNFSILPAYNSVLLAGGWWGGAREYLWPTFRSLLQLAPFILIPAAVGMGTAAFRRRSRPGPIVIWFLAALAGILIQRRFYLYHWAVVIPAAAALAAIGWTALAAGIKKPWGWMLAVTLLIVSCLPGWLVYRAYAMKWGERWRCLGGDPAAAEAWGWHFEEDSFSWINGEAAGDFIRENSKPGDRIFVWGFDGTPYFYSQRLPATGYAGNYAAAPWFPERDRKAFEATFMKDPPVFFVVPRRQVVYPIIGTFDGPGALLAAMPALEEYFQRHYMPVAEAGPYLIYRLKADISSG